MGTVRYFDNNQRVQFHGDTSRLPEVQLTADQMVLEYDEVTYGPIEEGFAYRIRFIVEDGVVETFETGPYAGQWDYTAGTLTKVKLYNADGDLIMSISGLALSMPYVSALVSDNSWNAVNHILGQGHRFVGADLTVPDDPDEGDDIQTGRGDDRVVGGQGNDWIHDAGGQDVYLGGEGSDTLSYQSHHWALPADTSGIIARLDRGYVIGTDGIRDRIESIERIQGSMFDDRLIGDAGDNRFEGMGGNDFVNGKGGWDVLRLDDRDYLAGVQGVKVDMAAGTARDAWGTVDTFRNIEEVHGTDFEDVFRDDAGDNAVQGEGGDDRIIFGRGNDYAEGGGGADTFVFRGNAFGFDHVEDFEDGVDLLRVRNAPDYEALTIEQDGDDTLVLWNGNEIRLNDILATDITEDDFIF